MPSVNRSQVEDRSTAIDVTVGRLESPGFRFGGVFEHYGLADPEQDKFLKLLLPDISDAADRRRVALDHLRKCLERAEHLAAALDVPAKRPEGLILQLIAGDAVPTARIATADSSTGKLEVIRRGPGDGSVLRSSALADQRVGREWTPTLVTPIDWSSVTFLFTDHLGLTKDPAFTDNVLFQLLEYRPMIAPE